MSETDRQWKEQRAAFEASRLTRRKESIAAFMALRNGPVVEHPNLGKRPARWRVLARRAWDRKYKEATKQPMFESKYIDDATLILEERIVASAKYRIEHGMKVPNVASVSPESFWDIAHRLNAKVEEESESTFMVFDVGKHRLRVVSEPDKPPGFPYMFAWIPGLVV